MAKDQLNILTNPMKPIYRKCNWCRLHCVLGTAVACRGQCTEPEEPVAPAHPIREVEHSAVRGAEHSDHPPLSHCSTVAHSNSRSHLPKSLFNY